MPNDIIGLIDYLIGLGIITIDAAQAYDRLKTGIAAQATNEGREVTAEEQAVITHAEDLATARRRGQ